MEKIELLKLSKLELAELGLEQEIQELKIGVNEVIINQNFDVKFYQTRISKFIENIYNLKREIEKIKEEEEELKEWSNENE